MPNYHATAQGLVAFTAEEEVEWAEMQAVPPEAPRRLIPKSVVQERINAVGKLGAALTALNAQPLYFARWFAPNYPNVFFDDPDMLALLAAVGCAAGEIEAITAPA